MRTSPLEYVASTPVRANYLEPQLKWDLSPTANDFDGLDALDRVIDNRWISTADASDVDRVQYGYDRLSNRTSRKNPVAETANDELYRYDGVQRLVDLARGTLVDDDARIENPQAAERWNLDATGNWGRYQSLDFVAGDNSLDQTRATNAANELTEFASYYGPQWSQPQYDRAGNMTAFPQPNAPTEGYTAVYDAWNRLVKVTDGATVVQANAYDGLFRRTTQTADSETRRYYYSKHWQVLEERLNSSTDPERQFVWGVRYIDDLVLRDRDPDGTSGLVERLYALNDANWNVTSIVNEAGEVQERYRYTAYGMPTFLDTEFAPREPNESEVDWETLFCGYRWDIKSGLFQVRHRYLNSAVGSWTTSDPLEYTGSWNLLNYVSACPLQKRDPSGLLRDLVTITEEGLQTAAEGGVEGLKWVGRGLGAIFIVLFDPTPMGDGEIRRPIPRLDEMPTEQEVKTESKPEIDSCDFPPYNKYPKCKTRFYDWEWDNYPGLPQFLEIMEAHDRIFDPDEHGFNRIDSADCPYDPAKVGKHINIYCLGHMGDPRYFVGSILCCPCCKVVANGPIITGGCYVHEDDTWIKWWRF